jgi:hypothetical protein
LLGMGADKPGRVRLYLYSANKLDDVIGVISSFEPAGWQYSVQVPDQLERQKLIRGVVHVVLLELANRGQGPKSAELPLWLVEGLTMHLSMTSGQELAIGSVPLGSMLRLVYEDMPRRGLNTGNQDATTARRTMDPLSNARGHLRANRPLSLSELTHPKPEYLSGEGFNLYQYCAQLFVHELLKREKGPSNLTAMLRELPNCWNWETAFLRVYNADFERMLDLEKWWSVHHLAFISYDPSQVWSLIASMERLDRALLVPAEIRAATNALPQKEMVSLQQVVSSWDYRSQVSALHQRLPVLLSMRANSSLEILPLIDGYFKALADYLDKRAQSGRAPESRMQPVISVTKATQDLLKELDDLDRRREELRPGRS